MVACTWSALAGLATMFSDGAPRMLAMLLAIWVPVAVLLGSMRGTDPRSHWVRMGAGVVLLASGTCIDTVLRTVGDAAANALNVSDLLFALGYGFLASGIWTLLRLHGRDEMDEGVLDAVVMLVPPIVLLVEYVAHVPPLGNDISWSLRLLAAGFPLLDVILLAALVWLLASPTLTRGHLGLLVAGMALTLLADMALAVEVMSPDASLRRVTEGLFPLAYALLAAGVATGASIRSGRAREESVVHWGRIGVLSFGAVLGPLVVLIAAMPPEPLPTLWVSLAVVGTSSFIVWRMLALARFLGVTTAELARARRELEVRATHDPLTALLNRAVLDDVLDSLGSPESRPAALLSIDLDTFKRINDTHGHSAGDAVLQAAAVRLCEVVRAQDIVVRMGGDEFLAVLRGVGAAEARGIARRFIDALEEPVRHDGLELYVSASVGIAMVTREDGARAAEAAVARADSAMYRAKRSRVGSLGAIAEAPDVDPDRVAPIGASFVGDDEAAQRPRNGTVDPRR